MNLAPSAWNLTLTLTLTHTRTELPDASQAKDFQLLEGTIQNS